MNVSESSRPVSKRSVSGDGTGRFSLSLNSRMTRSCRGLPSEFVMTTVASSPMHSPAVLQSITALEEGRRVYVPSRRHYLGHEDPLVPGCDVHAGVAAAADRSRGNTRSLAGAERLDNADRLLAHPGARMPPRRRERREVARAHEVDDVPARERPDETAPLGDLGAEVRPRR